MCDLTRLINENNARYWKVPNGTFQTIVREFIAAFEDKIIANAEFTLLNHNNPFDEYHVCIHTKELTNFKTSTGLRIFTRNSQNEGWCFFPFAMKPVLTAIRIIFARHQAKFINYIISDASNPVKVDYMMQYFPNYLIIKFGRKHVD